VDKKLSIEANLDEGIISSIRGSIVDIYFKKCLPPLSTVLHAGINEEIIIEVLSQPDAHPVSLQNMSLMRMY